jgi:DNA-binding GntR family transcriptional regulator
MCKGWDEKTMNLKRNLDDVVYRTICSGFADGTYTSGSKLIPVELAEKYGVSKTPVIQALKRMGYEGILNVSSGGKYSIPIYNEREIHEICDVRIMIEKHAVRNLAKKYTKQNGERLSKLADLVFQYNQKGDSVNQIIADNNFHRAFIEISGNNCLLAFFDIVINRFLVAYYVVNLKPNHLTTALEEHRQMLALMEKGQFEEAAQLIEHHIKNSRRRMYEGTQYFSEMQLE